MEIHWNEATLRPTNKYDNKLKTESINICRNPVPKKHRKLNTKMKVKGAIVIVNRWKKREFRIGFDCVYHCKCETLFVLLCYMFFCVNTIM